MAINLLMRMQNKVLSFGLCAKCTRRLSRAKNREALNQETDIVECRCGQSYSYDRLHRKYHIYRETKLAQIHV